MRHQSDNLFFLEVGINPLPEPAAAYDMLQRYAFERYGSCLVPDSSWPFIVADLRRKAEEVSREFGIQFHIETYLGGRERAPRLRCVCPISGHSWSYEAVLSVKSIPVSYILNHSESGDLLYADPLDVYTCGLLFDEVDGSPSDDADQEGGVL